MRNLRRILTAGALAVLVAFAGTSAAVAVPVSPPSPHATRHHHHVLARSRVRKIQQALHAHGAKINVDGVWGPKTVAAVRRFQRLHGLRATGRVDHATMRHLLQHGLSHLSPAQGGESRGRIDGPDFGSPPTAAGLAREISAGAVSPRAAPALIEGIPMAASRFSTTKGFERKSSRAAYRI